MKTRKALAVHLLWLLVLSSNTREAFAGEPDTAIAPGTQPPPSWPTYYVPLYYVPNDPRAPGWAPPRLPYRSGDPIPPGYQLRTNTNTTFLAIGLPVLGGLWLLTATVGMGLDCLQGDGFAGEQKKDYSPLYIPAFGPFIATGIGEPSADTVGLLIADGVLQTAGLVTLVLAAAYPKQYLVHRPPKIRPSVSRNAAGLELVASF